MSPLLKEHQRGGPGGQYESGDDVIQSVEQFLQKHYKLFLPTGIQKMEKQWIRCTEVHGDMQKNRMVSLSCCICLYIRPETFGTTLVL